MLLAVIVTQIVLFSATGNKTFIFTLPFIFFLIWVLRRGNPYAWIYFVFGAFCLAGIFSYWSVGDRWTYFIFARRTLLAPAQLAFFYRDFFSQNSLLYLSAHHFFSWITIYPYKLDPPNLIGTLYLNSPQTSANNGIYSDAFMNFGYWGFVIWAVVFSFIMKLIDSLSRKKDFALCLAAVSMLPIVFTNAALLTSIFTNGLLVALVMIYLAPVENEI